jgi:hypothetical protein
MHAKDEEGGYSRAGRGQARGARRQGVHGKCRSESKDEERRRVEEGVRVEEKSLTQRVAELHC